MLLNNYFSKRNKLLYKMKCINTRNEEYTSLEDSEYNKIEKFKD